jgi:hypothetical protein
VQPGMDVFDRSGELGSCRHPYQSPRHDSTAYRSPDKNRGTCAIGRRSPRIGTALWHYNEVMRIPVGLVQHLGRTAAIGAAERQVGPVYRPPRQPETAREPHRRLTTQGRRDASAAVLRRGAPGEERAAAGQETSAAFRPSRC